MKTERRHSYGIIPIFRSADGVEVLVVKQTGLGTTYWSFAKGTPEYNETPIETARREMKEEVGIDFDDVNEEVTFSENYSFEHNGTQIKKTTTYFVGFVRDKNVTPEDDEIDEAKWLPLKSVEDCLTFSETKRVFHKVKEYLR